MPIIIYFVFSGLKHFEIKKLIAIFNQGNWSTINQKVYFDIPFNNSIVHEAFINRIDYKHNRYFLFCKNVINSVKTFVLSFKFINIPWNTQPTNSIRIHTVLGWSLYGRSLIFDAKMAGFRVLLATA